MLLILFCPFRMGLRSLFDEVWIFRVLCEVFLRIPADALAFIDDLRHTIETPFAPLHRELHRFPAKPTND